MTRRLALVLATALVVVLTTTATQAQFTPDPLYDFRASDNAAHPDAFSNLGTLGGELGVQGLPPQLGFDTFAFYNVQEGDGSFDFLTGGDDVVIDNGFTYEMLVRRTGDGFATNEHQLASIAEGGDNEVFLFIGTKSDNRGGVDFGDAQADIFTLPAGEWTHFMISVDDETDMAKLYVNGGAPTTFDFAGINFNENPANDVTLFKTRGSESDSRRFDGDISEARLYDFVLTDEQAMANYRAAVPEDTVFPPTSVGGRGAIGSQDVVGSFANQVFTEPEGSAPGLGQAWYGSSGPTGRNRATNKAGVDKTAQLNDRAIPYFHGEEGTWWSGSNFVDDVQPYPTDLDGAIETEGGNEGFDFYTVKLDGEILIEESGTVRFLDGVDDYAYLAIDTDRSGIAGDSASEVLINDDNWTDALAKEPVDDDDPPPSIVSVDFEGIAEGGEWLAIEFNMVEVDGGDTAMLYWDAQDTAGVFPTADGEGVAIENAPGLLVPDTHLRGPTTPAEHVSSDVIGTIPERSLGWEVDVNPADGTSDSFVVGNLGEGRTEIDANDVTTILDVEGAEIHINPLSEVAEGDSFQIIDADAVTGSLTIATKGWSFDATTGTVSYSRLDDGLLDPEERRTYVHDVLGTWVGDSNRDGEFNSSDLVSVLAAGEYEDGISGNSTWAEGDWNGDMEFDTGDLVYALGDGGYEVGPRAANAAVPEPSSLVLLLMGALALVRRRR